MPHSRNDWHERLKAIEREFRAVKIAIQHLSTLAARDPNVLGRGLTRRDLVTAANHLEGTYLIRLFAEFKAGIRSYWRTIRPGALAAIRVLLIRVGARRRINPAVIQDADEVRKLRNALVHDRTERTVRVDIEEARRYLAKYFAYLPLNWRA